MKTILTLLCIAALLAGCATRSSRSGASQNVAGVEGGSAFAASSADAYKRDLAERIAAVNAGKIYPGRPQALLRSVIVLKFVVDANGRLLRSEIQRSNKDRSAEATALASLRGSAPFPKPAAHLLQHGRLELSETWLFNNDGRFQLRTIAQPQMDQ